MTWLTSLGFSFNQVIGAKLFCQSRLFCSRTWKNLYKKRGNLYIEVSNVEQLFFEKLKIKTLPDEDQMSVLGIVELEPQKEFHAQTSPVMNFQH